MHVSASGFNIAGIDEPAESENYQTQYYIAINVDNYYFHQQFLIEPA